MNVRREPSSEPGVFVAGVVVASEPLSGIIKGKPKVRTSAYASERRRVLLETRDNTLTKRRSEKFPNECALRLCLTSALTSALEVFGRKEAEADRLGGRGGCQQRQIWRLNLAHDKMKMKSTNFRQGPCPATSVDSCFL